MLGQLPTSLKVNGKDYAIRSDYKNILRIIAAYNSPKLRDREKVLVCLKRLYLDFASIPLADYEAAYTAAANFIECQVKSDKPGPQMVDWEKDEQMIFASINKVAGREVRDGQYMHWWTFLGYFQSIDRDDLYGFVLAIRQKRSKHRKLEKHEQEFYNANRSMCDIGKRVDRRREAENYAERLYAELSAGKG